MACEPLEPLAGDTTALGAHLLGEVPLADVLRWQRRLVYEVGGRRDEGVLALCTHPPAVSVGRQGSSSDLRVGPEELASLGWSVLRVNRGGGTVLHSPGQLAAYCVVALDRLNLTPAAYVDALHRAAASALRQLGVRATREPGRCGLYAGGRLVAQVGAAVRDWVSSFGLYVNVRPDLEPYRLVDCDGPGRPPMTSLERELCGPVRPTAVRQRLAEALSDELGFGRLSLLPPPAHLRLTRLHHDAEAGGPAA